MNFVLFGVKKSGIGVFLVSVENGAGVKKMTNFRYELNQAICCPVPISGLKYRIF